MEGEWIQVRMKREVYARLRAFGKRVLKLVEQGRVQADVPRDGGISINALVAVLLDRDDKAQARNARSKEKRS